MQAQQQPKHAPQDNMPIANYDDEPASQKVYTYVERMPVYRQGGVGGLQAYWRTNLQQAPPPGVRQLLLSFIVGQDGKAYQPLVLPDNGRVPESTRQHVLRLFQGMGEFTPGRQNGKPVNVSFTIPLTPAAP